MKRRTFGPAQRQRTSLQTKKWKPLLIRVVFALILVAVLFTLWILIQFSPRTVVCETHIHTYCQDAEEAIVAQLKKSSFWSVQEQKSDLLQQLQMVSPSIQDISITRSLLGNVIVEITYSEALFQIEINAEKFTVRNKGVLTPGTEAVSVLVLDSNTDWETFLNSTPNREETLKGLQQLALFTASFRPTIRKVTVVSSEEIHAFPEGGGKILLHARSMAEMRSQMATLQAFFHSTTIDKSFTELDVRFEDVIVR